MEQKSLGEKLQSLPRQALYGLLVLVTAIPLFFSLTVPNKPLAPAIDAFEQLATLQPGSTVIIQTDWTNSTRGESGGGFEALIRILMRKDVKFAIYSGADAQAPQVARDVIARINDERVKAGQRRYERWTDWVSLGFFPDVGAMNIAMRTDIRKAWGARRDSDPSGQLRDVFQSPVLQNVTKFTDVNMFVIVTASATLTTAIERLGGQGVPLVGVVTGVMGPEALPYYETKQLSGLTIGLKGAYDLETMMEHGINAPDPQSAVVKVPDKGVIPGFPGDPNNKGRGTRYYPTLHFALTLLILAVVIGNVGMYMARKGAKR